MSETSLIGDTAAEFRRVFDLSFTMPPSQGSRDVDDFLAIRVAGDPYAIRLREIAGIVAGRPVVPIPSKRRDLLGLVGIRGGIVPVFGLPSVLGYDQAPEASRWMILCGTDELIALALADFEGYLRLPSTCLYTDERVDENVTAARRYVQQFASTDSGVRAVINIPLVIAMIRNRIDRPSQYRSNDQWCAHGHLDRKSQPVSPRSFCCCCSSVSLLSMHSRRSWQPRTV